MKNSKLLIAAVLTFNFGLLTLNSSAQLTNLYNFAGPFATPPDGGSPEGSLFYDGTFLYGTTYAGGANNSKGTIFKIMPDGTGYVELYQFGTTGDGQNPEGSLISDGTFLYGTTQQGGTNNDGTIFKIMPDGTGYLKLLDFAGTSNGNYPHGSLFYAAPFLYGMTAAGGANSGGNIFKIKPDGTGFVDVFDFASGNGPHGDLFSDGTFFYGMTGDYVFKIKPDGTGFVNLHNFSGGSSGSHAIGSLIYDGTFLYGMTYAGGTVITYYPNGGGIIFKIKPDGTGFVDLLDFIGANGVNPEGSLFSDGTFMYGTTYAGGAHTYGVIFKIMPDGTGNSNLLDFSGPPANGSQPCASFISVGTCLYGTTYAGSNVVGNHGTVFKYCGIAATGITENNTEDIGYSVYPNPFTAQTTITFNEEQKLCKIKIIDELGKQVKSIDFKGKQLVIEKGEMKEGIYFLQINDGYKNVVNSKIIIQ